MLWAITTYFNPAQYRSRHRNYKIFRSKLEVPLLAVELSFTGEFELHAEDADIVVRLIGGARLWQKERLLNVALRNLPPEATEIAWLDCDVIFPDSGWHSFAAVALQEKPLVQLFTRLFDLRPCQESAESALIDQAPAGLSVSHLILSKTFSAADIRPKGTVAFRRCLCGLAWAARRDLLQEHGFYDAMIVGSGDRALAYAAFGWLEAFREAVGLSEGRAKHYMQWATRFFEAVQAKVGVLDLSLVHLWHGSIVNRHYHDRHVRLNELNYDPYFDITCLPDQAFQWARQNEALHEFVASYFEIRREDGEAHSESSANCG